jgi:hypothetical protein
MAAGPIDLRDADFAGGNLPHRGERLIHWLILIAAISVPLLGACMTTLDGEQVAMAGLERYPLPTLCSSRWLGVQCPTCGVTRSIIELMHGNLSDSLAFHRVGWLILVFIMLQIPYRIVRLRCPTKRWPRLERWGIAMLLAIGVAVVVNRVAEVFLLK